MNWLLYIGGFWLGFCIVAKINRGMAKYLTDLIIDMIAWGMVWIWFCMKFIAG